MSKLQLTASQTVGPFFAPCLLRQDARRQTLVEPHTPGQPVRLEGRVIDGSGESIPDALVEIWQADADGNYNYPADEENNRAGFSGYGRSDTAGESGYWFETIKPGPVQFEEGRLQAPHVCLSVFARGLLNHLVTRLYFEDEAANSSDPVLAMVPPQRRSTLLARRVAGSDRPVYRLDLILQGDNETVFFNL